MNKQCAKISILFLICSALPADSNGQQPTSDFKATSYDQTTDSTMLISSEVQRDTLMPVGHSETFDESDGFSPGLLFFLMIGFVVVLMGVGAGIALTAVALSILFGLVSLGILSTSIIVGLNKKSFKRGFKTFVLLASTIGGVLGSTVGFWMLNKIVHWWTTQTALITGATAGLLAGFACGLLIYYVLQRLTTYFKQMLKLPKTFDGEINHE